MGSFIILTGLCYNLPLTSISGHVIPRDSLNDILYSRNTVFLCTMKMQSDFFPDRLDQFDVLTL